MTGFEYTAAADTLDKLDMCIVREAAGAAARALLRMVVAPEALPVGRERPEAVQRALVEAGLEAPLRRQGAWPFLCLIGLVYAK
jgi:hypothetical protein